MRDPAFELVADLQDASRPVLLRVFVFPLFRCQQRIAILQLL